MPKRFIKKGVILPNNERDYWECVNKLFRSNLHHNNEIYLGQICTITMKY